MMLVDTSVWIGHLLWTRDKRLFIVADALGHGLC